MGGWPGLAGSRSGAGRGLGSRERQGEGRAAGSGAGAGGLVRRGCRAGARPRGGPSRGSSGPRSGVFLTAELILVSGPAWPLSPQRWCHTCASHSAGPSSQVHARRPAVQHQPSSLPPLCPLGPPPPAGHRPVGTCQGSQLTVVVASWANRCWMGPGHWCGVPLALRPLPDSWPRSCEALRRGFSHEQGLCCCCTWEGLGLSLLFPNLLVPNISLFSGDFFPRCISPAKPRNHLSLLGCRLDPNC